jgi:small subunit ribosomal protein S7
MGGKTKQDGLYPSARGGWREGLGQMPRKGPAPKRMTPPDPVYGSRLVGKFVNRMMLRGKKSLAERTFYSALDRIEETTNEKGIEVFERAIKNAMPVVEVKPRRVGGATYQVPVEVRSERRMALAMRWVISFARKRPGKTMVERLAAELIEAAQGQGASVRKKEEAHRMAEANKAFSHYRW